MEQHPGRAWLSPEQALSRHTPSSLLSTASNTAVVRYGFQIGNIGLLIGQDLLTEVVMDTPIYPVPKTANWFNGLINLRGNLIPVYDLHQLLLSRSAKDSHAQNATLQESREQAKLLVISDKQQIEKSVAILTWQLPQVVDTGHPLSHPPELPSILKKQVTTAYTQAGNIWLEFDHDALFFSIASQMNRVT